MKKGIIDTFREGISDVTGRPPEEISDEEIIKSIGSIKRLENCCEELKKAKVNQIVIDNTIFRTYYKANKINWTESMKITYCPFCGCKL